MQFLSRDVRWVPTAVWLLMTSMAVAEDQVTYATGPDGDGRTTVRGTILDHTGQKLTLQSSMGSPQEIPASRVLEVSTDWSPVKVQADQLFVDHQYDQALRLYGQALGDESRIWAQREILAQMICCLRQLERIEQAAEFFLRLVQSDPETIWFGRIPLSWQAVQPSAALEKRAEQWLQHANSQAAQLIGASWLLGTRHRAAAIETLQRLTSQGQVRIASLATAQLWRTQAAMVDQAELQRWGDLLQKMPREVRPGGLYVYAQALAARGHSERAALAWLRIGLLYADQDRSLAAWGLLSAGRELEKMGDHRQAASLYREILRDYAGTTTATRATDRLEALGSD
jgi:tetratricopeptide (TPR) repeat protein